MTTLVDTGPIVAALNRNDRHHAWAVEVVSALRAPLLTCEAVITEACYLVRALPGGSDAVLQLVERGLLEVSFALAEELASVRKLMKRYRNVPMSFADACLVRMTEHSRRSSILTVDSDFRIYRRNQRHVIPTITPF